MKSPLEENIILSLPIKINYSVIEAFLKEKMIGENISAENKDGEEVNYAQILDVGLDRSLEEGYDLALDLKFKTLTTLFKNKEAGILLHISLNFDKELQEVTVKDYKLEGTSQNWLMDNSIEALANKIIYNKLKDKMKFDFLSQIESQLQSLNNKLEKKIEPTDGVAISGYLNNFKVSQIIPGDSLFLIALEIDGYAFVDITKIPSPPQSN